jgi:ribosomal protein S18 acetylase RimI-like enzyme
VTLTLVPFPIDQTTSLALAADALRTRLAPGEELRDLLPPIESAIRSARATGGLLWSEGEAQGIVLWEPAGPLGVAVRLLYLSPPNADRELYRAALTLTERAAGPLAFAPGPMAGLSAEEESTMMRERGFAPYGRSEMSFPPAAPVPSVPVLPGGDVRPVRPADEPVLARLHERAYQDHLDRYLALESLDPVHDADRQLREYFAGRWGELLSPGSVIVTLDGRLVAAVIAVQRAAHVLILDVMTDPDLQGRGLGRVALASAVRALRGRSDSAIVLNVTEGNEPAVRLYSHLGFVRTMGPTKEWYDARRMSVRLPPGR